MERKCHTELFEYGIWTSPVRSDIASSKVLQIYRNVCPRYLHDCSLTCIYLSGNPAVTGLGESYRATMKTMLPLLEQLDGDMLTKQPIMRKRAES